MTLAAAAAPTASSEVVSLWHSWQLLVDSTVDRRDCMELIWALAHLLAHATPDLDAAQKVFQKELMFFPIRVLALGPVLAICPILFPKFLSKVFLPCMCVCVSVCECVCLCVPQVPVSHPIVDVCSSTCGTQLIGLISKKSNLAHAVLHIADLAEVCCDVRPEERSRGTFACGILTDTNVAACVTQTSDTLRR